MRFHPPLLFNSLSQSFRTDHARHCAVCSPERNSPFIFFRYLTPRPPSASLEVPFSPEPPPSLEAFWSSRDRADRFLPLSPLYKRFPRTCELLVRTDFIQKLLPSFSDHPVSPAQSLVLFLRGPICGFPDACSCITAPFFCLLFFQQIFPFESNRQELRHLPFAVPCE